MILFARNVRRRGMQHVVRNRHDSTIIMWWEIDMTVPLWRIIETCLGGLSVSRRNNDENIRNAFGSLLESEGKVGSEKNHTWTLSETNWRRKVGAHSKMLRRDTRGRGRQWQARVFGSMKTPILYRDPKDHKKYDIVREWYVLRNRWSVVIETSINEFAWFGWAFCFSPYREGQKHRAFQREPW